MKGRKCVRRGVSKLFIFSILTHARWSYVHEFTIFSPREPSLVFARNSWPCLVCVRSHFAYFVVQFCKVNYWDVKDLHSLHISRSEFCETIDSIFIYIAYFKGFEFIRKIKHWFSSSLSMYEALLKLILRVCCHDFYGVSFASLAFAGLG